MIAIGIDLGGTKTELIALAPEGTTLRRERIDTPRDDYPGTIAGIVQLIEMAETALQERATVGVGIPGAISRHTGRIKNANSTWLIGQDLPGDLARRLNRPIRVANDANCFALSEAVDGAAAGASTVFGVILGTGTGGGVVIDGQILVGANTIGGEWGHNPMPWMTPREHPGKPCYCGRTGCIETFLSGPGWTADMQQQFGLAGPARAIAAAARAGDAASRAAVEIYADRLARALATVINIVDPEVIVLGGGLSGIESLYDRVPALWTEYVFSDRVDTRLRPPRYGDSSGVRGAAWLGRIES